MKDETVEVGLQILLRNVFVRSPHRSFDVLPEVLNVVDLHVTSHVLAFVVID